MKIALCMPHYSGLVQFDAARAMFALASKVPERQIVTYGVCSSLLAMSFNRALAVALELVKTEGVTHFAMLHADVVPIAWWLDTLVEEQQRTGADVISVVIPLKENSGVTSTAIDDPANSWCPAKRLTMTEVAALPETFSAEDAGYPGRALLINTGCWIADLTRDFWFATDENGVSPLSFTIQDQLRWLPGEGKFTTRVQSEDWHFGRVLHRLGRKVMATRKVYAEHIGESRWGNAGAWGDCKVDPQTPGERIEEVA